MRFRVSGLGFRIYRDSVLYMLPLRHGLSHLSHDDGHDQLVSSLSCLTARVHSSVVTLVFELKCTTTTI